MAPETFIAKAAAQSPIEFGSLMLLATVAKGKTVMIMETMC